MRNENDKRKRIMAVIKAKEPVAVSANHINLATGIFWVHLKHMLELLEKEQEIERIETTAGDFFRVKREIVL